MPIELHIAELFIGESGDIIVTNGVGSCVVVIIHDKHAHVGGIGHAILPYEREEEHGKHYTLDASGRCAVRYVDRTIDILVAELEGHGGSRERFCAKLVGGAHMFALLEDEKNSIGMRNLAAARERLAAHGIPIESEVTGGNVGRSVRFDCASGSVEVVTRV